MAEYLIHGLIVDIACGVFSWVPMDIHEVFKTYAAKRGSDSFGGILGAQRNVDVIKVFVFLEIVPEPAHDVRLLKLGEALKATVNTNEPNS